MANAMKKLLSRQLDLSNLLKKKSFFLFGPRATGKSSLIKQQFSNKPLYINLLSNTTYLALSEHPEKLSQIVAADADKSPIAIDEVQRVPSLLNEVHLLIEEKQLKFILTGSSSRNLKKKNVNLLAGRAWQAQLFPLVSAEIPTFDLYRYLQFGGLPAVYLSKDPAEELYAYVDTYLKEEIQYEGAVRNLPRFSRFLTTAALTNGQMLNFTQIGSDVGLSPSTVREHYYILEETFLGAMLPAFTNTKKRKAISTAKFYFFDIGVCNTLAGIKNLDKHSDLFGRNFEHFIFMELRAYLSYRRLREPLQYWRSKHGHEVDFIIGDSTAIGVKATERVQDKHLKGLNYFAEENIAQQFFLISRDQTLRKQGNINIIHWQEFLTNLWADRYQL